LTVRLSSTLLDRTSRRASRNLLEERHSELQTDGQNFTKLSLPRGLV